ncbi:hypothetical protein [Novosphingobium sp.]|uniref:hypothetical protein n=1 Tax=Novosphingobium sp. TaxID=1874826 RepID=UPI00286AA79E|nr:hypothetical protein [Novosphingobium sp.]
MKMNALLVRISLAALPLVLMGESAALAQADAQLSASDEPATITVTGNREKRAEAAANQAKAITPKPSGDVPLPRHYAPLCVVTFGIDPNYGEVLAQRVTDNARLLGLAVGGPKCSPNVWIGFVQNSKAEVAKLRRTSPEMFAGLKQFEIDRIFGGSGAAQVWNSTEQRSLDGKPIAYMTINGRAVKMNPQYQAGRLVSPVRTDINGSLVIFDLARANGLTLQQLADYATMRILAPVQDIAKVEPGTVASILTLFAVDSDRPVGLTEFDWAYLSALYRLDRGAKAAAVHDATEKAMLDGTATALSEKANAD